jgi:hypothetical protein
MGVKFRFPGRPARGPVTVLTELSLFPTVSRWVTYVFPALPFVKHHAVCLQHLAGSADSGVHGFRSAERETGASVVTRRVPKDQANDMWNKHLSTGVWASLYRRLVLYVMCTKSVKLTHNGDVIGASVHILYAERIYRVLHQDFHFNTI